jgi:hypothetical protein
MRRAAGLALLLALVVAAPAAAQAPGPAYLHFEDQPVGRDVDAVYAERGDVVFADGDSCGSVQGAGGNLGPRFLGDTCGAVSVTFRDLQAQVSLFGRLEFFPSRLGTSPSFIVTAFDANNQPIGPPVNEENNGLTWDPVTVRVSTASIRRIEVDTLFNAAVQVDDIGFSPFRQPDTAITGGPANPTTSTDATFTFAGNQSGLTFTCRLDQSPAESCTSPVSYSGLALGSHTFSVFARDRWGTVEETPATSTWTINAPPPPPPVADRDLDGVVDATDNCPDTANATQGDVDGDGIGDACEIFKSGTSPIEAGREVTARVLSGEVFVRLPAGASASAFTAGLRAPFQDSGFLPLKGVAAIPVGSVVDARRGSLALTAAINGRPAGDRRQLRRQAQFAAGIFAIRQKRAARKRPNRRRPPSIVLASAPGAESPCARRAAPVRVRSLTTTAKGVFRTVGGASTATPLKGNPTFITTDRCDGTVTEVGRGRVAVASNRTGRRRTVRAGRAYIVKARLFAARKGRRSG